MSDYRVSASSPQRAGVTVTTRPRAQAQASWGGPPGPTGPAGPPGPTGPTGAPGAPGTTLKSHDVAAGLAGAKAVTTDRRAITAVATLAALTSGTCYAVLMSVDQPLTTAGVRFVTGTTAAAALTNQWAALTDAAGTVVAVTADAGAAALAPNAVINWNWTAPANLQAANYYVHLMIAGTTVPTLLGLGQTAAISKLPPPTNGPGAAGRTGPPAVGAVLPMPATGGAGIAYMELT